ncbi:MAG: M28 family peptidase [Bacteroidia bacterium]
MNRKAFLFSVVGVLLIVAFTYSLVAPACNTPKERVDSTTVKQQTPRIKGPVFSPDSAYAHLKKQVLFGPRIPNSPAHVLCGNYLTDQLKRYGLEVTVQQGAATTFDGTKIQMKNIFGQFKPERKERILLLAHWDTRPFADRDSTRTTEPFDGANDGAGSVAVLLEIGRILAQKDPGIGIDILLVDAEDYGAPQNASQVNTTDTWCLGSQYWAQNLKSGYNARFGILLDMVAGKNPIFPREGTSMYFAANVVQKVWNSARDLGYGSVFVEDISGETTDDHLFINQYARIPTIDIVHYDPKLRDYGSFHHRHSDNLDNIDPATMLMVGNVLIDVIYNELPQDQPAN